MPIVHQKILEAENKIRFKAKETGMLFSPEGELLWEQTGDKESVDVFEPIMKGLMRGAIFTHNHPLTVSFSLNDYKVFIAHDLLEMRAVDKQFSYSLSFDLDRPKPCVAFLLNQALLADKKLEKEYKKRLTADPDDEMYDDYAHEWFRRLGEQVPGLIYARTELEETKHVSQG